MEVAVIPVLLGEGVPILPPPSTRITLPLTGHRIYPKTGTVALEYIVQHGRRTSTTSGRQSADD